MSTSVAKHFTDFASKRDFRLGERPSWTRSQQGQGATKVYAKMREASYRANAPLIRNRRLAQSIGYDPNYALNVKMNREISDRHFMDSMSANTTTATDKLKGLRSHITPVFTNTQKPNAISSRLPKAVIVNWESESCLAPSVRWRVSLFRVEETVPTNCGLTTT